VLRTRRKEFLIKKCSELCELCGEISIAALVALEPRGSFVEKQRGEVSGKNIELAIDLIAGIVDTY
jgi:hypothetical protein